MQLPTSNEPIKSQTATATGPQSSVVTYTLESGVVITESRISVDGRMSVSFKMNGRKISLALGEALTMEPAYTHTASTYTSADGSQDTEFIFSDGEIWKMDNRGAGGRVRVGFQWFAGDNRHRASVDQLAVRLGQSQLTGTIEQMGAGSAREAETDLAVVPAPADDLEAVTVEPTEAQVWKPIGADHWLNQPGPYAGDAVGVVLSHPEPQPITWPQPVAQEDRTDWPTPSAIKYPGGYWAALGLPDPGAAVPQELPEVTALRAAREARAAAFEKSLGKEDPVLLQALDLAEIRAAIATVEADPTGPQPNGYPIGVPARLVTAGDYVNGYHRSDTTGAFNSQMSPQAHVVISTGKNLAGTRLIVLRAPGTEHGYTMEIPKESLDALTFAVTMRGDSSSPARRNQILGLPTGSGLMISTADTTLSTPSEPWGPGL